MKLAMMLPVLPDSRWKHAVQLGVNYAITKAAPELSGRKDPSDLDSLYHIKKNFKQEGLTLYGLEGDEFDMNRIKLGLPGWEEDIARYQKMLQNMGELGINLLCYNFMAGIGWYRTDSNLKERGNALTCGFSANKTKELPELISKEDLWNNYKRFIQSVMPVAEKARVRMAIHPDDPPVNHLLGYSRIFTNAQAYRKAMAISGSPFHGITFCQSCFKLMGEDVPELIKEWGKRIFFLHIRDVNGTRANFRETFHDNGPTDMAMIMEQAARYAPDCVIRPDHTPSMAGEEAMPAGYAALGNIFAVGYIRGIAHGRNLLLT